MRSLPYERPQAETISEHTRPAPKRRPWRRNACTDTPAIGASTTRDAISTSPIRNGELRLVDCTLQPSVRCSLAPSRRMCFVRPDEVNWAAGPYGGIVERDVLLTQEGYEKLQEELASLSTDKRREVADRIRVAREFGDISENSEFDDAKNEQMLLEKQIAKLEERLRSARIIDPSDADAGAVGVGLEVTVKDVDRKRDGDVPHRRLGRGRPVCGPSLERVARRACAHGQEEGRDGRGERSGRRAQAQDRQHPSSRREREPPLSTFFPTASPTAPRSPRCAQRMAISSPVRRRGSATGSPGACWAGG